MAILKVAQLGNPVLRKKAKGVSSSRIKSKDFQKFLDDLVETMRDGSGDFCSTGASRWGVLRQE